MIGPLISGFVIISVAAYETSNGHVSWVWVATFVVAFRLIQDYGLSPQLMRRAVKLNPMLVLFGIFAGAEVGGLGGVFLSVPVLALGRLAYYEWRRNHWKLDSLHLSMSTGLSTEERVS